MDQVRDSFDIELGQNTKDLTITLLVLGCCTEMSEGNKLGKKDLFWLTISEKGVMWKI